MINKLLEINGLDPELWIILSKIYESFLNYEYAIHCMEELIIINPENLNYYVKLGELLYSTKTQENLEIAKKYFSFVILKESNLRALYGLKQTLVSLSKLRENKDENVLLQKILKEINGYKRLFN